MDLQNFRKNIRTRDRINTYTRSLIGLEISKKRASIQAEKEMKRRLEKLKKSAPTTPQATEVTDMSFQKKPKKIDHLANHRELVAKGMQHSEILFNKGGQNSFQNSLISEQVWNEFIEAHK
jgi:Flp pilus assembly CpaF family ATPase